jgi:N-acetylmuramoyl-L-alanine amidase
MPAILNEGAFVDNKKDIEDWNDDAELKKMGIAYAEATAEYCKLAKKVTAPKVEEPAKETSGKIYRVQVGAYREKANAEAMQKKLKAAGFDGVIV